MSNVEVLLTIVVSIMGVIVIPVLLMAFRAAIRWKEIEDKLAEVMKDVHEIAEDKNRVHAELYAQMRQDRDATNLRLRWLEEHLWKGSGH